MTIVSALINLRGIHWYSSESYAIIHKWSTLVKWSLHASWCVSVEGSHDPGPSPRRSHDPGPSPQRSHDPAPSPQRNHMTQDCIQWPLTLKDNTILEPLERKDTIRLHWCHCRCMEVEVNGISQLTLGYLEAILPGLSQGGSNHWQI